MNATFGHNETAVRLGILSIVESREAVGTPDERDVEHGCPPLCPNGLFGNDIAELSQKESHRHKNWGRHGMVYWSSNSLKKLAVAA